jgi:hypothetical protein
VSVLGEVQSVWITTVIGFLANLIALALVALKIGRWTGQVDAERAADREANKLAFAGAALAVTDLKEDTAKAFYEVKATLGNGAPGTVVRTNVCEALHGGVQSNLALVREDIRSLHDAVNQLHDKP